jgi:predicted 3-demethylubiquinone-9 3-methyltransferase (glyoxalase superfamily)
MKIQKITPCLWLDNQSREAAAFYCALFDNSAIQSDSGTLVEFTLDGTNFIALNGGGVSQFNEAVSFYVLCEDQEEIDRLWQALALNGGSAGRCGWCKDKFGVSWQIVPRQFVEMMKTGTPGQIQKLIGVLMNTHKMVIEDFEKVYTSDNQDS